MLSICQTQLNYRKKNYDRKNSTNFEEKEYFVEISCSKNVKENFAWRKNEKKIGKLFQNITNFFGPKPIMAIYGERGNFFSILADWGEAPCGDDDVCPNFLFHEEAAQG